MNPDKQRKVTGAPRGAGNDTVPPHMRENNVCVAGVQVETIGDAYMVVAGAPEVRANHAESICDMALDMVEGITGLTDPSTGMFSGLAN